jgi:thiol-disulfide isomerase/thioredoxin
MKKIFLPFFFCMSLVVSYAQTTLDTAVNFQVKDIYGATHKLFDILDSNKYVVLNFHTTSCGPCVTYAPDMQQAYMQYGENLGNVYFLGIVWGASNIAVHDFDSTYGITYPCVSGSQGNGNSVILSFDIQSYPTAILIAPDHYIVNKYMYPPSFQVLDSNLSAVLGTTGINLDQQDHSQFVGNIYPNPVLSTVDLKFKIPATVSLQFAIVNVIGEKLIEKQAAEFEPGIHQQNIDATGLKPGVYFLQIFNGKKAIKTFKFVKS